MVVVDSLAQTVSRMGKTTPMTATSELSRIRQILGTPYYESESVLLYHGDCRELMGALSGQATFPLTITSPPYNIGKEYEEPLPLDAYLDWCESWIRAIWDVTDPNGALWLNLGYVEVPGVAKALPLPYLLWNRNPFYLIQEVVWHYEAGVAAKKSLSPRNEKWLWLVKNAHDYYFDLDAIRDPDVKYPNQRKNGILKVNSIGKNPSDVWRIAKVTSGSGRSSAERAPHPAQFPMELVERIVRGFSAPEKVLLDPFMGSGTVAEVALRHGRKAVGFELNRHYLDYAVTRIKTAESDLDSRLPIVVEREQLRVLDDSRQQSCLA